MYGNSRTRIGSTASSYRSSASSGSTPDYMYKGGSVDFYPPFCPRRHTLDRTTQPIGKRMYKTSDQCGRSDVKAYTSKSALKSEAVYIHKSASSVVITDSYRSGNNIREKLIQSRRQAKSADTVDNLNGEISKEILTPFEAVAGMKLEAPSYWISCSYAYRAKTKTVDFTIRQTGVLPDLDVSKLTLEITIPVGKSKKLKKDVVLRRSSTDTSFKSSHVSFSDIKEKHAKVLQARFRIFGSNWLPKRKVSEWQMPLNDCHEKPKIQWKRVSFEE